DKQDVYIADAYDLPVKKSNILKYLIARRQSKGSEILKSTFVSVLEPYASNAYVQSAKLLSLNTGNGTALEVIRAGISDVIISDTSNTVKKISKYAIETDASNAVVSVDKKGQLQRVFFSNGTFLRYKGRTFKAQPVTGTIIAINP